MKLFLEIKKNQWHRNVKNNGAQKVMDEQHYYKIDISLRGGLPIPCFAANIKLIYCNTLQFQSIWFY